MNEPLPLLAADLMFVRVNGGRAYSGLVDWDEDRGPRVGDHVMVTAAPDRWKRLSKTSAPTAPSCCPFWRTGHQTPLRADSAKQAALSPGINLRATVRV